jgi:ABC-type multidrug transport system fused ATPase/permease subunit
MIIHTYIYTNIYIYIGATRDEIISAAKMANAHDFITAFPAGYDTQVRSDDDDDDV